MSDLIKLKNRINAIETTEKVTRAMRLISMSQHTKLKQTAVAVETYDQELFNIFSSVKQLNLDWKNPLVAQESDRTLVILIGSQKGLCGVFNTQLFAFFGNHTKKFNQFDLIGVGKKACDFLINKTKYKPIKQITQLTSSKIITVTNEIFDLIKNSKPNYSKIIVFYNYPKSFLKQIPLEKQIIPLDYIEGKGNLLNEIVWEQPKEQILDFLAEEYLRFTIQKSLSESLLAEQAARFQSMDSATRNAENILTSMKKQYSKQRQAKITKELIELSGAF